MKRLKVRIVGSFYNSVFSMITFHYNNYVFYGFDLLYYFILYIFYNNISLEQLKSIEINYAIIKRFNGT